MNVYWHGTAPAAVSSTVTAMRESVRVSLHAARPWQPRCNRLAGAVITLSVRTPLERALTDHD